jgi:hypothetical protein
VIDEYLARQVVRERAARIEADARRAVAPPDGLASGHLVEMVRRALTVRDLGRLALVSFLVMLLGIGVVGLWTAATEPRPPRTQSDLP